MAALNLDSYLKQIQKQIEKKEKEIDILNTKKDAILSELAEANKDLKELKSFADEQNKLIKMQLSFMDKVSNSDSAKKTKAESKSKAQAEKEESEIEEMIQDENEY